MTVSSTSNSSTISGLAASTNYNWQVKANCSGFSSVAGFTTSATSGCSAPGSLSSTNITQTAATLNWSSVFGATGYTVQYRPSTSGTWITINSTTTSYSLGGLTGSTNYT